MKSFSKPAPRQAQIMQLLADVWPMPMTSEAIALECGMGHARTWMILRTMGLEGRVLKLARYTYSPDRGSFCVFGAVRTE